MAVMLLLHVAVCRVGSPSLAPLAPIMRVGERMSSPVGHFPMVVVVRGVSHGERPTPPPTLIHTRDSPGDAEGMGGEVEGSEWVGGLAGSINQELNRGNK